MPLFSRIPTLRQLRRELRDAGYEEIQNTDTSGQIVWHFYRNLYRHDFAADRNTPIQEYCGKATCRNPEPYMNWFGIIRQRGTPEFHYPAITPTNQTAVEPTGGGWTARKTAQDLIPDRTFSEVP